MSQLPKPEEHRKPDYAIEPLIYRRWSPRSMNAQPLSEEEMLTLFEAARWAPSTYNEHEWRFLYARRDTPEFSTVRSTVGQDFDAKPRNSAQRTAKAKLRIT